MDTEEDIKGRLHQGTGRMQAIVELAEVVDAAMQEGTGLDAVLEWMGQQREELKAERHVLMREWGRLKAAEAG